MSWEAIAGFSSSVIALCALFLTIWQAYLIRRHNRLAVTPFLITRTDANYDDDHYRIELLNNGIGPARITSFGINVKGEEIRGEASEKIENTLKILFIGYSYTSSTGFLKPGYMMAPNERCVLVDIQFADATAPTRQEVEAKAGSVQVIIDYESIYGGKFSLNTDEFKPKAQQGDGETYNVVR
jgi:hypothetical protein